MSDYEDKYRNGRDDYASVGERRSYTLDNESENRLISHNDESTLSLLQEQKKINAELMDEMKNMQQQIRMMANTMMNMNGAGGMGQNNMSSMGFGGMMGGMGMGNSDSAMRNPMMGANMMSAGNGAMNNNMAGMPLGGITSNMGQGYRDDFGGGKMGCGPSAAGGGSGSRSQPYNMRVPKQPGDWDCPLCGNMNFSRRNTCNGNAGKCGEEKKPEYVRVGVAKDNEKDWICSKCGNSNYYYRAKCNKCGVTQLESMMFGPQKKQNEDWHCPRCRNINYHYRTVCNRQNCDFEKKDLPNQGNPMMNGGNNSLANMEAMAAMMNSMQSLSNSMGISQPPMGGMSPMSNGMGMPSSSARGNMNSGNRGGGGGGGGKVTLRRHHGPEPRDGDWECPRCYNLNFGSRDMCNGTLNGTDCRLKKPDFQTFGVKAWKDASKIKDTDWDCWRCGNVNFQSRDTCNRCKLSRAEAQSEDLRLTTC